MEVDDIEASRAENVQSEHPIDIDHQRVMSEAIGEPLPLQLLLDLHP